MAGRDLTVILNTDLSPELIAEGHAREIISRIQKLRKELDFNVSDRIAVAVPR